MLNKAEQQSGVVAAPHSQLDQSFAVFSLPEGRDKFNAAFQPLFLRIVRMSGGNVRFGDHDSYFVELPGGSNPYVYHYDDDAAFDEIWKNVILAEHGWPSAEVLEQMLFADAEYDGKPYDRPSLSDKNRAFFDKLGRTIECQLKGRVNDKRTQEMFFVIADEYDVEPIRRTGGRHVVPYTRDGAMWMRALVKLGLKQRETLISKEQGTVRSHEELKIIDEFKKQLEVLQGEVVKNYIEANNGIDVLFTHCTERLFFKFDKQGLYGFYHLVAKVQDLTSYSSSDYVIGRDVVRTWFIDALKPFAERVGLTITIESDRKYRFPAIGSTRRESFTLVNYYRVWSFLANKNHR